VFGIARHLSKDYQLFAETEFAGVEFFFKEKSSFSFYFTLLFLYLLWGKHHSSKSVKIFNDLFDSVIETMSP